MIKIRYQGWPFQNYKKKSLNFHTSNSEWPDYTTPSDLAWSDADDNPDGPPDAAQDDACAGGGDGPRAGATDAANDAGGDEHTSSLSKNERQTEEQVLESKVPFPKLGERRRSLKKGADKTGEKLWDRLSQKLKHQRLNDLGLFGY